jgi:DNA-binding PadR family transcriptional regulator
MPGGAVSAKHALLGLLQDRPAYPYELANSLRQRLGPAWALNSGQLYQTIKALEKDSLIERVDPVSPDRARNVFAITHDGAAEFDQWFRATATAVRLSRRPLLVQITLGGRERLPEILEKIEAYELECIARLSELDRLRDEVGEDAPLVRADHVLLRVNLRADVLQIDADLRWARYAREEISMLQGRDAIWPSRPKRDETEARVASSRARKALFERIAASERADSDSPSSTPRDKGE